MKRVLIIKPSSLGDIVHGLPVLAGLRTAFPDAYIAWLVADGFAPLLEKHPLLNRVIRFDRKRYGTIWRNPAAMRDFLAFLVGLRKERFDLVIDLQGLFRSGFFTALSGARQRVGFSDARELAWAGYTQRVVPPPGHAVDRNLAIARKLELPVDPPQFPLGLSDNERREADDRLRAVGLARTGFVAVLPGARWATKQWYAGKWAAMIDRLHAQGIRTLLLGSPSEKSLGDEIVAQCGDPPTNWIGRTTLRALVALIDAAERVACCDSGPMHIAAALDKPLVALFGPTATDRTGPYSPIAQVVQLGLECSPCYKRTCPLGHHRCLKDISADRVATAVTGLSGPLSVHNPSSGAPSE